MFSYCRAPTGGVLSAHKPFSGRALVSRPRTHRSPLCTQHSMNGVLAMIPEWPDPEFIEETKAVFPGKMIANVEEARVLFSNDGYVYLDVRSNLEYEEVGKVKGSVNVPYFLASRVWSPEEKKKVVKKEPNENFIAMVKKRFPNPETKLLVACSNGTTYSLDALEDLDEAGYVNLVGLKGGFNAWFRVFDNKLGRRRGDGYTETYTHDGDSCGIHAAGAGFDRVDKIETWVPPSY